MRRCQFCYKPHYALGMCQAHYRQDLRKRHRDGGIIRPYQADTNPIDLATLRRIIDEYKANK